MLRFAAGSVSPHQGTCYPGKVPAACQNHPPCQSALWKGNLLSLPRKKNKKKKISAAHCKPERLSHVLLPTPKMGKPPAATSAGTAFAPHRGFCSLSPACGSCCDPRGCSVTHGLLLPGCTHGDGDAVPCQEPSAAGGGLPGSSWFGEGRHKPSGCSQTRGTFPSPESPGKTPASRHTATALQSKLSRCCKQP